MILKIYSVFDAAIKAYMPPFTMRADGEAIRALSQTVQDTNHQFHRHAEDYSLHLLGTFDDNSGNVEHQLPAPVHITSCIALLPDPQLELTEEGQAVANGEAPRVTREGVPGLLHDPRQQGLEDNI